jgi:hypothetical protein
MENNINLSVSEEVISIIIEKTVMEIPGIYDINGGIIDGITNMLGTKRVKGIKVDIEEKTISAATIKELWNTPPVYESKFSEMTNFVNFAPNIAFNDEFNYKGFSKFGDYIAFVDEFKNNNFEEVTGVGIETLIPNGLNPREFGEFRSYLQLPFINIYKLFAIFKNKFETLSDYKIEYDDLWFNEKNPYWANLVYTLKPLDLNNSNSILKTYNSSFSQSQKWNTSYGNTTQQTLTTSITGNDEYISSNRIKITYIPRILNFSKITTRYLNIWIFLKPIANCLICSTLFPFPFMIATIWRFFE